MQRKLIINLRNSKSCFLILLFLMNISAYAQNDRVTGTIKDENGELLSGVTVSLKNSASSTVTDDRGTFSIIVPSLRGTLVFSSIGFIPLEVEVNGKSALDISLTTELKSMEEVVVVGYGTQKKVNLTGAVSVITSSQIDRRPNVSTSAALQGLAPGVTVTSQTGAPGGDGAQIRIRGINSFGGSNSNPLVIIDGVAGSIDNVDANLIESISVLKDAASAAIYGSRAANGVILITTKRARDKMSVNYRGYVGKQTPTEIPEVTDGLTYMNVFNDASMNDNGIKIYSDQDIEDFRQKYNQDPKNYDWQDAIFQGSGMTQNHFISVMANTGIVRVAPSISFVEQDGIIKNTNFKRYTFRNNLDITPSDKFNIKFDVSVTNKNRTQIADEGTIWNYLGRMPTNIPIRHNNDLWSEGWVKINPVGYIEEGGNRKTNNMEFLGNLSLTYKPVDWLSLTGMAAPRYITHNVHAFTKSVMTYSEDGSEAGAANTFIDLSEAAYRYFYGTYQFQATAQKTYGDHNFSLMGGASRETYDEKSLSGYRRDFIYNTYEVLSAGADDGTKDNNSSHAQWLLVSTFGRLNYNFQGKYLFEANMRYDGTSRFIGDNRWAAFPSFSAGWLISNESFMKDIEAINMLKIRASWGKLGNQNIGSSYYPFSEPLSLGSVSMGGQIYQMITQTTLSNPSLKWEETEMKGVGLDAMLFNKLSLTFDWYDKMTDGILLKLNTSQLTGLNPPYQNAAVVSNKGWEIAARYDERWGDFRFGIDFNLSDVKNKIVDMKGQSSGDLLRQQEGYSINSIYGYLADGLYQSQDEIANGPTQIGSLKPGDVRYKDIAGGFDADGKSIPDGRITDADKVIIGNTIPRYTYGGNLDLGWKGFRFSAFVQGVGKTDGYLNAHYVIPLANSSAVKPWQLDYWSVNNTNASLPRVSVTSTNNTQNSTLWMRSAAYLRLKNIQLGYELPKTLLSKVGLTSAFIFVNGQNVFTNTNFYQGYDPEINYNASAPDGVSLGGGNFYPQVKVFTLGIDIKL